MGSYGPTGCAWATFAGENATRWPSDDAGANTATAASSTLASATETTVHGILITVTANGSILLSNHAGTTLTGHTIPVTTLTTVPQFIRLGGRDGLKVPSGISATAPTGVTFTLYYRRAQ